MAVMRFTLTLIHTHTFHGHYTRPVLDEEEATLLLLRRRRRQWKRCRGMHLTCSDTEFGGIDSNADAAAAADETWLVVLERRRRR